MKEMKPKTKLSLVNGDLPKPSGNESFSSYTGQHIESLKVAFKKFKTINQFIPGQIVRWKSMLRNRKRPAYDEPIIVVDVLKTPVHDTVNRSGSPYYREPLDLIVGHLDKEEGFLLWHVDSRRMEPCD
ncbi:MAG: hypothetical protein AB2689_08750 [Candidatus Thiodiazotropha taylori]